jgi:predicted transcriptional regulator
VGRPKKYHTEEDRLEGIRQSKRKHYNTHREAINARRAKRARKRRAAIKAGQKEAEAGT